MQPVAVSFHLPVNKRLLSLASGHGGKVLGLDLLHFRSHLLLQIINLAFFFQVVLTLSGLVYGGCQKLRLLARQLGKIQAQ